MEPRLALGSQQRVPGLQWKPRAVGGVGPHCWPGGTDTLAVEKKNNS